MSEQEIDALLCRWFDLLVDAFDLVEAKLILNRIMDDPEGIEDNITEEFPEAAALILGGEWELLDELEESLDHMYGHFAQGNNPDTDIARRLA